MEEIIQYKANDDSIHQTKTAAIERDNLIADMNKIKELLPPEPKDEYCKFANGQGYLQCDPENVNKAKAMLLDLANKHMNSNFTSIEGLLGRYLNDSNSPLYNIWFRFQCIDNKSRMWGQPYFVAHPLLEVVYTE